MISLILIPVYLLVFASACIAGLYTILVTTLPPPLSDIQIGLNAALVGGLGGVIYCLRAVYVNACVHKNWQSSWIPWYLIRPFVSMLCGGISYVFLKAGLLILESGTRPDSTELGFYALALIAGLNVDKFINKIEDIAQAAWGIEPSRASKTNKRDPE